MSEMRKRHTRLVVLFATLAAAQLLGFGLGGAALSSWNITTVAAQPTKNANQPTEQPTPQPSPTPHNGSIFEEILGTRGGTSVGAPEEGLWSAAARILFRLVLAALLAAAIAFRPRHDTPVLLRNPFVAQTQILMAVIASALMMIVGDSAARAFGIFAAASLVRFRTNIQDPKEITVLLLCLSMGLATGVGHWELGVLLALFMLALLWLLERYEPGQVTRPMELSVTTRRVEHTQAILKRLFRRHRFNAEVRQLDRESEEAPLGRIVYFVNVSGSVSTDLLSSEIQAAGGDDIDAIEWQQSKGVSYIYK
jgi:uncharacterized membrane protein YhiD involved in acid resistance